MSDEKLGAELALESAAAEIRKHDPDLSAQPAFVKAMDLHPDLGRIAIG